MNTPAKLAAACLFGAALTTPFSAIAYNRDSGRGSGPVVNVTSPGLFSIPSC